MPSSSEILAIVQSVVSIAALPLGPSGRPANVTIGAGFYAVPTYSQNKDEAFQFSRTMLGDVLQQAVADGGIRPPVLKSILLSDDFKAKQPVMYAIGQGFKGDVSGLPTFKNAT